VWLCFCLYIYIHISMIYPSLSISHTSYIPMKNIYIDIDIDILFEKSIHTHISTKTTKLGGSTKYTIHGGTCRVKKFFGLLPTIFF